MSNMYVKYAVWALWIVANLMVVSTALGEISTRYQINSTVLETTEESANNTYNETLSSSTVNYGSFTEEFIQCPKFHLPPEDYVLFENATLYIPAYAGSYNSSIYEPGNYYIDGTNESYPIAYICSPNFVVPTNAERERKSKGPLSYITFVCLSISIIGLALHFAAFLIVPEMRNLPGRNLASLTFSLFTTYLLYLIGIVFDKTQACHPLGILIYYFMMVSFFWMNTISFDIFKSVKAATTKLRTSEKSAEFKRFVLYSTYSWLVPALFLTVVLIAEETELFPYRLRPLFVDNRCWFRQRLPIIVFFATPAAILMLTNAIFFIASAVMISSNSIKSNKQKSNLKRSILLYLKLIVISGLLWITGLVAEFVRKEVFSYITLTLYTLQGLYIFIAFTRFKKVADRFRASNGEMSHLNPSLFNSTASRRNPSKSTIISYSKSGN